MDINFEVVKFTITEQPYLKTIKIIANWILYPIDFFINNWLIYEILGFENGHNEFNVNAILIGWKRHNINCVNNLYLLWNICLSTTSQKSLSSSVLCCINNISDSFYINQVFPLIDHMKQINPSTTNFSFKLVDDKQNIVWLNGLHYNFTLWFFLYEKQTLFLN